MQRRLRPVLVVLVVLASSRVGAEPAGSPLGPLSPEVAKAFAAIRPDPPPERLTLDAHFVVSDEKAHHVFRRHIDGLGGVFVGLGTDQNYLMAGWARPEVLVPLDFDQFVVDLHFVYRAFFLAAPTAAEFGALWKEDGEKSAIAAIRAAEPDEARARYLERIFKKSRRFVARRMRSLHRIQREAGVSWFMTDGEQYAYVRGLFQTGRVFPIRGDLTRDRALRDVATAARASGMTVRVLYLSNAERYFRYNDAFSANALALPFDERSQVIRTGGESSLGDAPADGHYRYYVQSGPDFRAWFDGRKTPRNVYVLLRRCKEDDRWPGLYIAGPPRR